MNAGKDKWWIGVLALVIASCGGFSVHFMSNSNSAPASEPSTATTPDNTTSSSTATSKHHATPHSRRASQ